MAEEDDRIPSSSPSGEGLPLAPPRSSRADRASPVDLPEGPIDTLHPLVWTSAVIALATAYLFVANAISLDGWLAEQPPTSATMRLVTASANWKAGTEAIGMAAPRAALHRMWLQAEAARFPGQAEAE